MSPPISRADIPVATAAAEPPDDPPGVRATFHGLRVEPYTALWVCTSAPSRGTLVLPTTTAPAARRRATATASAAGMALRRSTAPAVAGRPATAIVSFTVIGTPWNGPRRAPVAT